MNPLLSPTSSSFLTLNQLSPHCTRLLNFLQDARTSHKDKILFEQTLWNEVKKIRALNDASIFLYLIGFYHAILYQVNNIDSTENDLFQYHVLIRLGDLNRYMDRLDIAEYYYCSARNVFPYFGHAYNQLGLLTKPSNCYKCCYYYARAARSSDKPLNTIADSNLRIAVSKYNCEVLHHILNGDTCLNDATREANDTDLCCKLPETGYEWFYVIVVAIYADNIQPITKLFLCYINENLSTQKATTIREKTKTITIYCDRESYILLAGLDILLDWLKLGSQGGTILPTINTELSQIRSSIQNIITSYNSDTFVKKNDSNDSFYSACERDSLGASANSLGSLNSTLQNLTNTSASLTDSPQSSTKLKLPAFPHDYVLRGFSPLDLVHKGLRFEIKFRPTGAMEDVSMYGDISTFENHSDLSKKYTNTRQLMQILMRIRQKLNAFKPQIKRRQTRNIALESILSNRELNNDL